MADCYYHGYSGGGGSCRGCERDSLEGIDNKDSTFKYETVPMEKNLEFDEYLAKELCDKT